MSRSKDRKHNQDEEAPQGPTSRVHVHVTATEQTLTRAPAQGLMQVYYLATAAGGRTGSRGSELLRASREGLGAPRVFVFVAGFTGGGRDVVRLAIVIVSLGVLRVADSQIVFLRRGGRDVVGVPPLSSVIFDGGGVAPLPDHVRAL